VPADRAGATRPVVGAVLAAAGACSFGVTVTIGRSLATAGLGATTVLGMRFTGAALPLVAWDVLARRGRARPGERLRSLALGVLYALESTLFFFALEHGTAAAVALLFYSYPAIVTLVEGAMGTTRIGRPVVTALCLSAAGTATIVLAGANIGITGAGVAFALCSASTFALYLLLSDRFLVRSDAVAKAGWVALGCGLSHFARGIVSGSLHDPAGHWPALLGNGLATASAFAFMFAGLRLLGPARTSVVLTLEAFAAIVLAAVFLGESIGAVQLVGGVAILAGAVLVARAPVPADEAP
jgi:drug/metabolite transporter (DMT)-like permease